MAPKNNKRGLVCTFDSPINKTTYSFACDILFLIYFFKCDKVLVTQENI